MGGEGRREVRREDGGEGEGGDRIEGEGGGGRMKEGARRGEIGERKE